MDVYVTEKFLWLHHTHKHTGAGWFSFIVLLCTCNNRICDDGVYEQVHVGIDWPPSLPTPLLLLRRCCCGVNGKLGFVCVCAYGSVFLCVEDRYFFIV
ncbi:hypothetical protein GWI33_017971 [Rhynchophorus ferrugineus]|uniref:Uncharacterized protein n=1 Tax=Rhynchophorus ferrugineus TaxID=354439 RepID=A0A834HUQ5_RHYFE|nr:hypothetical protein GWI33_017971 [Rhynchophorus ferrugineus]